MYERIPLQISEKLKKKILLTIDGSSQFRCDKFQRRGNSVIAGHSKAVCTFFWISHYNHVFKSFPLRIPVGTDSLLLFMAVPSIRSLLMLFFITLTMQRKQFCFPLHCDTVREGRSKIYFIVIYEERTYLVRKCIHRIHYI